MHVKLIYLFHAVEYLAIWSWAREQPADLAYNRLLDRTKSHMTVLAEYYQGKESRWDFTAFPTTVSTSINAVCSKENNSKHSPSGHVTDVA